MTLGAYAGSGTFNYNGDVAEVLIYDRALSSNDVNKVGRYLGDKYGVTTSFPALPELPPPAGTVISIR